MGRTVLSLMGLTLLLGTAGASADIHNDPDLVIHYSFDDFDRVVADESGKGHDGTTQGNVAPFSEPGHRAAKFAGKSGPAGFGYVDLDGENFPATDIPRTGITLAAWAKCDNSGDHHAIFNARANDATWVVHPELRSDGEFRWLLRAALGARILEIRAPGVVWGEWLHYAGMYDKATAKATLYINGRIAGQQTVDNASEIAGDWGKGARVGINVDNARPFTGLMDEFFLFKRALSEAELAEAMQLPPQLKAYGPTPPDEARNVTMPLLQWKAGDTAVLHEVYVAIDPQLHPDDLIFPRTTQTTIPLLLSSKIPVIPGMTYFWRVDEVEADGKTVHEGDIWSFTMASLKASDPSPRDGARWVDTEADLSWFPGMEALSHDVYFGTDKAAVEANAPGVLKASQGAMTYDPGPLAQNTAYYWRVDEHVADGTVRRGDLWSFTTVGPGAGVVARYFMGTEFTGLPVLTQVEGPIDHDWGSGVVAAGLSDALSARWTADLEAPFMETFQLITTSDDKVRLWLDNRRLINNWRDHGSTDDLVEVDLVAGQVYRLEMEWADNSGTAIAKLSWQSPSIVREIIPPGPLQLPVRAAGPYPGNTALGVTQTPIFHWIAGEKAAQHEIYFGRDANAVANATIPVVRQERDGTRYDPGVLEWGTTYYWRVDEVNTAEAASPWKGSLWTFTTADFIVVDDFESYTDEVGERVFQTWLDGFGYTEPRVVEGNGTGATVGYIDPPFAEQMILHSGIQSMPMDYDNTASPYYSEAERTWAAPQNWTLNGVDTLVLYVRGKLTNGVDRLYVAVEDNAGTVGIVIHPDATAVTATQWFEWKIPLSDLNTAGVNVKTVKTLYIGVGNRTTPTQGGAGSLYVDDIRVMKAGS